MKRTFGSSNPGQVTFQTKFEDHISLNPFIKSSLPGKYSRQIIPCGLVHTALKTGRKAMMWEWWSHGSSALGDMQMLSALAFYTKKLMIQRKQWKPTSKETAAVLTAANHQPGGTLKAVSQFSRTSGCASAEAVSCPPHFSSDPWLQSSLSRWNLCVVPSVLQKQNSGLLPFAWNWSIECSFKK